MPRHYQDLKEKLQQYEKREEEERLQDEAESRVMGTVSRIFGLQTTGPEAATAATSTAEAAGSARPMRRREQVHEATHGGW